MKIKPHSSVLFVGDSITFANRDEEGEPTPWHREGGLGHGYVALVNALCTASRPQDRLRMVNRGSNGWNVRNLKDTWQKLVLDFQPDWLSVMIGINDVWRQFDTPLKKENHVLLPEYEKTLDTLLAETRPKLNGLVLATPFVIERDRQDAMRLQIESYGQTVANLAKKYDAVFVDTQAAFDHLTAQRHPSEIAWDRIHPDTVGHMTIARAWLNAVGFDW